MRLISLLLCALLTACGDAQSPPSTVPTNSVPPSAVGPVVFIGDSITAYWPLPAGIIDAGVPGDTSAQMLARFDADVLAYSPATVVILAGTNDIRHLASPDQSNLFAMVEKAESAGAHVIVGTIPPINDWSAGMPVDAAQGNAEVMAWNRGIRDAAFAYGFEIADYYPRLVNPDNTQNAALFNSDHLHPNAAGYAVMTPVVNARLHGN